MTKMDSKDYGVRNQQTVYCTICGDQVYSNGWFYLMWGIDADTEESMSRFMLGCMDCFELNEEAKEIAEKKPRKRKTK